MCILSYGLVYVKKYNCKNVTYNLTGKCSLTNVADLLKSLLENINFLLSNLQISIMFVPLHCVFHSIRFKVNKGWSKALLLFYVYISA